MARNLLMRPALGCLLLLFGSCRFAVPAPGGVSDPDLSTTVDALEADAAVDAAVDAKVHRDAAVDLHWEAISNAPQVFQHRALPLADGRVLVVGGRQLAGSAFEMSQRSWLFDPGTSSFDEVGSMAVGRRDFTATLLADGRVLVAGGVSNDGYLSSTELFDPTTAKWSDGPAMFATRWGHAAVRLADGRVLLTGGFGSTDSTDTAWICDAQANAWSASANKMNHPRRQHGAVLLPDGDVLIAGGLRGATTVTEQSLDSLEIYNQSTGFTALAVKMSDPRYALQLVRLEDGRVLILGGFCSGDCSGGTHDLFDHTTGQVETVAHPGKAANGTIAALLGDGRLVALSGRNDPLKAFLFDPTSGGWTAAPDMLLMQDTAAAVTLADGTVLLVGGVADYDATPDTLADRAQRLLP